MGTISNLLSLPVSGPLGAVGWIARQIAEAAITELLDPVRIETALLVLVRKLEAGEIDEDAFEAEESRLLEELSEMRAIQAGAQIPQPESEAEPEPEAV
jgi:hypothetical protein